MHGSRTRIIVSKWDVSRAVINDIQNQHSGRWYRWQDKVCIKIAAILRHIPKKRIQGMHQRHFSTLAIQGCHHVRPYISKRTNGSTSQNWKQRRILSGIFRQSDIIILLQDFNYDKMPSSWSRCKNYSGNTKVVPLTMWPDCDLSSATSCVSILPKSAPPSGRRKTASFRKGNNATSLLDHFHRCIYREYLSNHDSARFG